MATRDDLLQLTDQLNGVIFERVAEINGLMWALLTRKHVCMIGGAGSSKSLLARLLTHALQGATLFDYQFSKTTMPEEVFGPPSLKALKEEDTWRFNTAGKLPEAVFAIADEVFEGNSAILNRMRKVMNERLFENDGGQQEVPLEVLIGATNLIPSEPNLAAMYDRFHLRYQVQYLQEPEHFYSMLRGPKTTAKFAERITVRIPLDALHGAQEEVKAVTVPESVEKAMWGIRSTLATQGILPSDRRWNDAHEILRARAWLHGRDVAEVGDLGVLTDMLWTEPAHKGLVQGTVLDVANPLLKDVEAVRDAVEIAYANLQKVTGGDAKKDRLLAGADALSKANDAVVRLKKIREQARDQHLDLGPIDVHVRAVKRVQRTLHEDLGLIEK